MQLLIRIIKTSKEMNMSDYEIQRKLDEIIKLLKEIKSYQGDIISLLDSIYSK